VAERRFVLVKGEHRYVFRVEAGREEELLTSLLGLAANDRLNFDWQDVAFFCHLIGKSVPTASN